MSWKRLSVTNATAPTAAAAATTGIAGIDNEEYAPPPPSASQGDKLAVTVSSCHDDIEPGEVQADIIIKGPQS